ncbi:AfsR/SARP family transcriptional regulator [Pseudonocardia sp. TRM90224]|uniref:AfsR/SARP family transcriptional regulator n=1 Tax=Pseudonocardia sp. TRM90224 TaxID=2812678 RepID=UPI001E64266E|nr:BTAD domain-containing putative transcriptional regulator [Pseudonocardia sp. TRM90224]
MEFRILGPVEVYGKNGQAQLGGGKAGALLAALVLQANRTVSHEHLISAVWGDNPPDTATAALHTYVFRLRRALGAVDAEGAERILTRKNGYLLSAQAGEIDLELFHASVEKGRSAVAAGRLDEAIERFVHATGLWRGPALSSGTDTAALDEAYLAAVEELIELRLAMGATAELVPELNSLIAAHPLRERLREQLMLVLYRSGRQAEALAVYQRIYRQLIDELGITPGPALQELHQRILAADPALRSPIAAVVSTHVPRQLPSDVTHFTGRAGELAMLDALLDGTANATSGGSPSSAGCMSDGAPVIASIEGGAGVGKTALALHWAHQVAGDMPDGQLYINLRGHSQSDPMGPADALGRLLRALGVPQKQVPQETDEQAAMYRSLMAGRRMLVVLDNAAASDQVRPLLPGTSTCAVIVTSRFDLRGLTALDGARRVRLDVLPANEADELLRRTIGEQRARESAADVTALARLCARLPLALRIAAAHLVSNPRHRLADFVDQLVRGDLLANLRVHDDQQASVRAAFDLSYRALDAAQARLFRGIGLSPTPDVTAETAAALCAVPVAEAAELLERLAAAHLVESRRHGRYGCHDLLRLYAAERAGQEYDSPDRAAALHRLQAFFIQATGNAMRVLQPAISDEPATTTSDPAVPVPRFPDLGSALGWLDAERAGISAMVWHAGKHGLRPVVWRLGRALRSYLYLGMNVTTGSKGAAYVPSERNDVASRIDRLHHHANLRFRAGDHAAALDAEWNALALVAQDGGHRCEAEIATVYGLACWLLGRPEEAIDSLVNALELHRRRGNDLGQANAHLGLGILYDDVAAWDEALQHCAAALDVSKKIESPFGEALALHCTAMVYGNLGRYGEALDLHAEVYQRYRHLDEGHYESAVLFSSAVVHRDAGDYELALADADRSLQLARSAGDRRAEADILNALGSIAQLTGRPADAVGHHREAKNLAARISFRRAEIEALIGLAAALAGAGRPDEAIAAGTTALDGAQARGFRQWEGHALVAIAEVHIAAGRFDRAIERAGQALALHREIRHRLGEARALRALGEAVAACGDAASALRHRQAAQNILDAQPGDAAGAVASSCDTVTKV